MTSRLLLGTIVFLVAGVLAVRSAAPAVAQAPTYSAGWNLVAGPEGSKLTGNSGSIYTLQPGDTAYRQLPADSPLRAGWGYWAFYSSGSSGSIQFGTAPDPPAGQLLPVAAAGSYVMIGDPAGQASAAVTNAAVAYTYTPDGGYQQATTLKPGQGAFAFAPATLFIGNQGSVNFPGNPACSPVTATSGTIQAQAGDQFIVSLESNRTTGFSWQLVGAVDPAILSFVRSDYVPPPNGGPPSAGVTGKECWAFKATAAGQARLDFAYRRPFEPLSTDPARTASFTVVVR